MAMGGGSCPKVMNSNPSIIYLMHIFHIHICSKMCNVFGRTKINEKRPGLAHLKKEIALPTIDCT